MSVNYGYPPIVTDGLVLHLDAANPKSYVSGSTSWNDLSGYRNVGTLTNGPTYSSANYGSIVFDGSNDYVDVTNTITLTTQYTISVFFSASPGIINKEVIARYNVPEDQFELWILSNGIISVYAYGATTASRPANIAINNGTWYNVVGVYNGSTPALDIYINGVLSNGSLVGTIPARLNTVSNNRINIANYGNNAYLYGKISVAQIYNRALTADEVLQNYNALKQRYIS